MNPDRFADLVENIVAFTSGFSAEEDCKPLMERYRDIIESPMHDTAVLCASWVDDDAPEWIREGMPISHIIIPVLLCFFAAGYKAGKSEKVPTWQSKGEPQHES